MAGTGSWKLADQLLPCLYYPNKRAQCTNDYHNNCCHPLDKKSPVPVSHGRPSNSNVGDTIKYQGNLEISTPIPKKFAFKTGFILCNTDVYFEFFDQVTQCITTLSATVLIRVTGIMNVRMNSLSMERRTQKSMRVRVNSHASFIM